MPNPVNDVRASGTQRMKGSGAAGPADDFQSMSVIDPDGVISRIGNAGNVRSQVFGDGRKWTPVQPTTPSTLVAGQYFIETVDGEEYFVYVDADGVARYLRAAGPTSITAVPVTPDPAASLGGGPYLADDIRAVSWPYSAFNNVLGQQETGFLYMGHNGTTGADATVVTVTAVESLTIGAGGAITFTGVLAGAGVAQTFALTAEASAADWQIQLGSPTLVG